MTTSGTLTHVEIQLAVTDGPTATNCYGQAFTVEEIIHRAYLYEGGYYRTIYAHGRMVDGTPTNAGFEEGDDLLEQLPAAPGWYEAIAEALRSKVEAPTCTAYGYPAGECTLPAGHGPLPDGREHDFRVGAA